MTYVTNGRQNTIRMSSVSNRNPWPNDVFQILRQHQVRQVAFVPDAGQAGLIRLCVPLDAGGAGAGSALALGYCL